MKINGIDIVLSRFPGMTMLNDNGIHEAIGKEMLKISPSIKDDQIQPGSFDVTIGDVFVFDDEYRRSKADANGFISIKDEPDRNGCKHYDDKKDNPILLPPRSYAEIYFHETIHAKDIDLTYELRSSRGRLHLFPNSIHPELDEFGMYVGVYNLNPNPMILYGQSKFASLFFHPRYETEHMGGPVVQKMPGLEDIMTPEGYVEFRAGKEMKTFKAHETIDTAKSLTEEYYDTHDLTNGFVLEKDVPSIIQLTPSVELPADLGIRLLHQIPFHSSMQEHGFLVADWHQVNAGWVDQGYKGSITAHKIKLFDRKLIKEGDIVCYGVLYAFNTKSRRAYGDAGLNSHYQGSTGATGSKS
jgi:deoxycytidine triphosphate deaminase